MKRQTKKDLFRFLALFSLGNVCLFLVLGLKYLYHIFSSETLFATSYYAYTSLWGKSFVIVILMLSYIGHFALLAFLPFMLLFPFVFILRRSVIFTLAILIWSTASIFLIADNILFSLFHFHINLTILGMLFSKDYNIIQFAGLSSKEMLIMGLMCSLILALESGLAILIWKFAVLKKKFKFEKKMIASLTACLCISYANFLVSISNLNNVFALQTPTLPFYNHILSAILPIKNSFALIANFSETHFAQPLFPVSKLSYPRQPLHFTRKKTQKNIIIIGVDTLRADAINPALTPHVLDFANKSWQFKNHYSGGNSTQAGLFSLFYGLPANYWESMRQQKRGALLIDELLKQGYQTKVLFGSEMIPPFHKTIFYAVPHLRTMAAFGKTIPDQDRSITIEFQNFLHQRDKQKPFFAFLFYVAAHGYCQTQNFSKLYPDSSENLQRFNINDIQALIKRYKNAVHFVDAEIQKILVSLESEDLLKNSIVIITSDHGEEFDDNKKGYYGHGCNYTRYQVQTPFIVWWPGEKPHIFQHQTTHYDLVPTLMTDVLGCVNSPSDYSVGKNLLNTKKKPYVLIGSYINMGIVEKNKITTLYASGNIQTTDDKMNVLFNEEIDKSILNEVLTEMRLFYRNSR